MTRALFDTLTIEERGLLRRLAPREALRRPAVTGKPFHHATASLDDPERGPFSEALVYGLVAKGVLDVTQAVQPYRGVGEYRPFSVVLSRAGEQARAHEMQARKGGGVRAAPDDGPAAQGRADA